MIYSRRYARLFIPLIQDSPEYNMTSRPCMGQGIIEIRNGNGKINISVQGLQTDKAYKAVLAGENAYSPIGNVPVDSSGKGSLKWEFDPDDIESKKIEAFDTVAIVIEENNSLRTPLIGYTSKVVNRKSGTNITALKKSYELINESVNNFVDNSHQNEPSFDKIPDNFDTFEQNNVDMFTTIENADNITSSDNDNSVDNSVDTVDNSLAENIDLNSVVSEFRKNVLELEHYTFLKKEDISDIPKPNISPLSDIDIIKNRPVISSPVTVDEKQATWHLITPGELGIIDDSLYPLSFSLFIAACYCRDDSLLYGTYTENGWEKQAIAIPDKNKLYTSQAARYGCTEYNNGCWIYRI
ncbi:MAG: hypothetical protein IJ583_12515 [Firmicutes bacterium]|nr:hypothetical protein [Bacillota bacterium]